MWHIKKYSQFTGLYYLSRYSNGRYYWSRNIHFAQLFVKDIADRVLEEQRNELSITDKLHSTLFCTQHYQ